MKIQNPPKAYPDPSKLVEGLTQLKVGPNDVFVLRRGTEQKADEISALAYEIATVTRKYVIILGAGEELSNISRADLINLIANND